MSRDDHRVKLLIEIFFWEFIRSMLPGMLQFLEYGSPVEFINKELISDITSGSHHEIDLLIKLKFKGQDSFFLIHIENQATHQKEFAFRMFLYVTKLVAKFNLPVYPIALLSYDTPRAEAPSGYDIEFPDLSVIQFKYKTIQLNKLSWRDYLENVNPVTIALMTKMNVAKQDRPKLRALCIKLLVNLKLKPEHTNIVVSFIEANLKLNAEEMKKYEHEINILPKEEQEDIMEFTSSWWQAGKKEGIQQGILEGIQKGMQEGIQKGMQQGIQEGKQQGLEQGTRELLLGQLEYRFGSLSQADRKRLQKLTLEGLNALGKQLFEMQSLKDVSKWLKEYSQ